MAQFVKAMFKKPKAIISPTFCSTSAGAVSFLSTTYGQNYSLTLSCLVGNIHISTLSTAPSTSVGFKLTSGDSIDLKVEDFLALVSDTTTAQYQGFIWED